LTYDDLQTHQNRIEVAKELFHTVFYLLVLADDGGIWRVVLSGKSDLRHLGAHFSSVIGHCLFVAAPMEKFACTFVILSSLAGI
jgi:hypothetical protein